MTDEMLEKLFPFKRNYFETLNHRIHYVDEGKGPAIVLFHACPMWSFSFRDLIKELSSDHRVIAFDLPGFGLSNRPDDFDYTLNGFINLTELFLNFLDLEEMTLVLHGWGGTVGMGYAVEHPHQIKSLIIMNSLGNSSYIPPLRLRLCRLPFLGPKLVSAFKLLQMGRVKPQSREVKEAYAYPYRDPAAFRVLQRFLEDIPTVPEADSVQRMLEIETGMWIFRSTPALILWATRDWLYPLRLLKFWRHFLPDAQIHKIPRAGRYIQEDAPEQLRIIIREFMKQYHL